MFHSSGYRHILVTAAAVPVLACLSALPLVGQGIRDSLFRIDQVEVRTARVFEKEMAGMRETSVDTTVLQEKVNLSLSDLLSENTTVFIKNHGRGALATASFRGTAPSHTQVTWNGININSPMAGMVDFSLVPVYLIDDLVLKHGAASLSHQSGGIGGSILIENTADWTGKDNIRFIQGIGSFGTWDEYLQIAAGNSSLKSRTRVYHNYSRNDFTFINRGIAHIDPQTGKLGHLTVTNDQAAYRRYGLLQEVYYRPADNQILSLKYWGQYADRSIPRATSYEGPDHSNLNNQQDADHKVVAEWKYYSDRTNWMVRSGYSAKQLNYILKNNVPGLGQIPAIFSISNQKSFLNAISLERDIGPDFSMKASMDMDVHQVSTSDTVSRTGYEGLRNKGSLFLSLGKGFADRLNLNLMLRQEIVDGILVPLIPYLGFDYRLFSGTDLILKGHVARNYHQPSLNDLYWQPGGNPRLQPEKGFTMEAGMEYITLFGGQTLGSSMTFYRSDIRQWIIWIPSYRGYWEARNIDRVISRGLELDLNLNGRIRSIDYRITGSYAYTSSVNYGNPEVWGDAAYGKQLVYIPLHSGNLMFKLSFRGFFLNYQYNAYSERFTTSSNDITRRDWLYPYFMNDFAAGKKIRIGTLDLMAELKIYNLFNETYHSILYRPMPGRNYQLVLMIGL
jgi:outer membrane cobalamin receptor